MSVFKGWIIQLITKHKKRRKCFAWNENRTGPDMVTPQWRSVFDLSERMQIWNYLKKSTFFEQSRQTGLHLLSHVTVKADLSVYSYVIFYVLSAVLLKHSGLLGCDAVSLGVKLPASQTTAVTSSSRPRTHFKRVLTNAIIKKAVLPTEW